MQPIEVGPTYWLTLPVPGFSMVTQPFLNSAVFYFTLIDLILLFLLYRIAFFLYVIWLLSLLLTEDCLRISHFQTSHKRGSEILKHILSTTDCFLLGTGPAIINLKATG